jgi:hypothetical protein
MRRSRVFADAEILSAPAQLRWPLHPPPMRFEQLDTYVRRLADAHGARLETFCRYGLGITREEWISFRDDPPPAVLARLSAGTGLSLRHLRNMTPRRSYVRLRIAVRDLVRNHPEQVAELTAWARQQTPV